MKTAAAQTPAARVKLSPALKLPAAATLLRFSNETAALPMQVMERLIGSEYKFLVERAAHERNLEYYAAKYQTAVGSIAAVNYKLPAPAWVIPVGFSDVAKLPRFSAYEVREQGVTIATLARNLKVDLADLKYYNGIKDTTMALTRHWLLVPQHTLPALDPASVPAEDSRPRQLDTKIGGERQFVIHKVGVDENLHQYASYYRTTLEAILTITATPPLWPGTYAVIPVDTTDASGLPRFEVHQLQTAASVEALARALNADVNKLSVYNGLRPNEELRPGEWVLVPRSRSSVLWRSALHRTG